VSNDVWFAASGFHLSERPKLFGIGFQPRRHFVPFQTLMPFYVSLKTGFQGFEQSFALFGRQLLFCFKAAHENFDLFQFARDILQPVMGPVDALSKG